MTHTPSLIHFRIANVQAGKHFDEAVVLMDSIQGTLSVVSCEGLDAIDGVEFDDQFAHLTGIAKMAGDYEFKLTCLVLFPDGNTEKTIGKLKLTVIPDPKTLWKNLPADATARFHKPDQESKSLTTPSCLLLGGSVRGRSHAHKGLHRDDHINLAYASATGWHVMCVADGAGSCKFSRRGSELVALASCRSLRQSLNGSNGEEIELAYNGCLAEATDENRRKLQNLYQQTIVKAVFDGTHAILDEVKRNEGDEFKDYSTTLLLSAYKQVSDGHLVITFWIGDGVAVIYQQNKAVTLLGSPDSGEYAGQTRFLTPSIFEDGSVYRRITMKKVSDMTGVILMTDGVSDAKFDTEKQLSDINLWDRHWSEIAPIIDSPDQALVEQSLLEWLNFWSPGNHDDRSITMCINKG